MRAEGTLFQCNAIAYMSYTTSYYHIVFRTYRSERTISEEHERDLYAYFTASPETSAARPTA